MKIVHDADACTGHGRCYLLAPELFEDDEYGHGLVKGDGTITADQLSAARKAVDSCPERAITIVDG